MVNQNIEFEQLGKSQYQMVVMEDCVQYANLFKSYATLKDDNINIALARQIATQALLLAARWSEIGTYADEANKKYKFGVTAFRQWAHEHYSLLREMHVDARMMCRDAKAELRENQIYGE